MPTLSPQAQAIVAAFGHQPGVTSDQVNNLQAVINASPVLIDQINNSVAAGHLQQFAPLAHANAGGEYDGHNKVMRLPLAMLTTPSPGQPPFNAGEPTFVLGHELQHGFNHAATSQAYRDFFHEASQKAQEPALPHDYTAATGRLIAANRRDEAGAEIAGWNAVVDRVKSTHSNPTLKDIYEEQPGRMKDFIDRSLGSAPHTHTLKPNLTLNPDFSLGATTPNLEAMGQNYFDKTPSNTGLGHHGNSDYANYYGAYAVGVAADLERHYNPPQPGVTSPPMAMNLSQLRLTEKLMEENGINLGTNTQPMPYLDSSTTPSTAGLFQHTLTTYQHTVPIAAQALEAEMAVLRQQRAGLPRPDPSQAGHPDHGLYQQIRTGVEQLDSGHHRTWDETSERMTASLLVLAKQDGLERVDHVVLSEQRRNLQKGENVFLVQGQLADPAHTRAMMKTKDAMSTPEVDSYRNLEALNQQKTQEQVRQPAMEQQQEAQRRTMTM